MESKIRNVNKEHRESLTKVEKLALWVTDHIGTIEFAIFCVLLVSVPLVWKSTMSVILYISSGYLQLVMLPLIMLGQNLQSRHSEKRAEADYELDVKNDIQIRTLIAHMEKQDALLSEIQKKLESK